MKKDTQLYCTLIWGSLLIVFLSFIFLSLPYENFEDEYADANLLITPADYLIAVAWFFGIILTIVLAIRNKNFRKISPIFLILLFVFSYILIMIQKYSSAYEIRNFFGDYNQGKIVYRTEFEGIIGNPRLVESFSLNNKHFNSYSVDDYYRVLDEKEKLYKEKGIYVDELSPDGKFIVYDYDNYRDNLSKIIVENTTSGETIVLAAGSDPIWIK